MATFVCVHGAFQGGWVFSRLAKALRDKGHQVHTPTLSGCGHHRHLMDRRCGIAAYCRDVISYLELEDLTGVILVGHSHSGVVLTAAMPELLPRLAGLVFIEAIIPEPGRSFADLGGEPFRNMLEARLRDGWLVDPWPAAMFGLEGSPAADWFMSRLAPFPLSGFTDPIPDVPRVFPEKRHYVRCAANPNPMLAAMAQKAETCGFSMHAIDSGHCPQMTVPEALAATLAGIADTVAGPA